MPPTLPLPSKHVFVLVCEMSPVAASHYLLFVVGQEVLLFPAMKPQEEPSAKGTNSDSVLALIFKICSLNFAAL